MANTSSLNKVAISYGFMGGPWHARRFNKLLAQKGYTRGPLKDADIIVAHSAGCWLIPDTVRPKLIIYAGMPLAQTELKKAWLEANLKSFRGRFWRSLIGKLKSGWYFTFHPIKNLNIIRRAQSAQPVIVSGVPTIFISNRYDPWLKSDTLQKHLDDKDWAFIELPGSHDYIWEHPEYYVEIINHYARLLAETSPR